MADIFGYEKQAKGMGNISSPSMVYVSIGGGEIRLAQSVTVQYSRQVQPVYELGSDSVWMTGAHSSGTININRAIGETGMLEPYAQDNACDTKTIIIGKKAGSCGLDPGTVTGTGSILENVGIELNVGGAIITDSATYRAGELSRG